MRRLASAVLAVAVSLPTAPTVALAAPSSLPSLLDQRISSFEGDAGIVVADGLSGQTVYAHNADTAVVTASLYKLGVLVEAERLVDAGVLHYTDPLTIQPEDVTEDGSYELPGTTLTLDDALEQMITISDNGAALALQRTLGAHQINVTLARLRIQPFALAEDPSDDNLASPRAIATLFTQLAQHALVSTAASDRMLQRLERQKINDRLPAQLPPGTVVAHKTGNLGFATHDAGIIYGKAGEPMVVVAMTWGSSEDDATELIQNIGSLVYANALASPTNVTYSMPQQPVNATAGRAIVQTVRLTNLGPSDWRLSDPDPYTLIWNMTDARGDVVGRSPPLPLWDVPVGKSVDYPVVLTVPAEPGDYKVVFGLANRANGALAALGAPTAALMVHASAPLLVSLGVSLSPLLHRNEASAALVTFTPLAELASPTRLSLGWRLVDRSNKAVTEGSVPVGLASPGKTVTYLVPFAAPSIRGPFTLELFATTENRVASVIVRKSVEIEAPRTYPGEPGAGAATRAGATPRP
jgi:beta-lactamase class A